MKTAIYIGGFCPLHRGHLDVIMRAKKENDRLFLIVYGYDNEPRAKQIGLTTDDRWHRIHNFLGDDEQITVLQANYEVKPDWDKLLADVLRMTSTNKKDVMIYTREPAYHQFLVINGFNCVYVRTYSNISAKVIRERPFDYMSMIANPFKKCFAKTILLTGASCEGKSTCGKDLATYFNGYYIPEASRQFVEARRMQFAECTAKHVKLFIKMQHEFIRSNTTLFPVVVSDGDAITNLSYAKWLSEDPNSNITKENYKQLEVFAKNHYFPFSMAFIFAPKESFMSDGVRDMAASFEMRKKHFELLCNMYEYIGQRYKIVSGSYYDNFRFIRDYIEQNI